MKFGKLLKTTSEGMPEMHSLFLRYKELKKHIKGMKGHPQPVPPEAPVAAPSSVEQVRPPQSAVGQQAATSVLHGVESQMLRVAQAADEAQGGGSANGSGPAAPPSAGTLSKEEQEFIKALNEVSHQEPTAHMSPQRPGDTMLLCGGSSQQCQPCLFVMPRPTTSLPHLPPLIPPPPPPYLPPPQDLSRFNNFFMSAEEDAVIKLQSLLDDVGAATAGPGGGHQEVLRGLMAQLVDFHGEGRGRRRGGSDEALELQGGSGATPPLGTMLMSFVWCSAQL
jgi:hypothetical protein